METGQTISEDVIEFAQEPYIEISAQVQDALGSISWEDFSIIHSGELFTALREIKGFNQVEVAKTIRAALQHLERWLFATLSTSYDPLYRKQYDAVSEVLAQMDLILDLI